MSNTEFQNTDYLGFHPIYVGQIQIDSAIPYLRDPKDDHILEVAVASQAQTIVTHNLKDFKGIEKFGIRAITPKQFLEEVK